MSTKKILKESNCEMQVVCGKDWGELDQTAEEGIRFCGDCKKLVFFTQTSSELRVAAEKGLCVYIAPQSKAAKAKENTLQTKFNVTRERLRQIEEQAPASLNRGLTGSVRMS